MSGILGVFHLDGEPAEMDELQAIVMATPAGSASRARLWCKGPVGFGRFESECEPKGGLEPMPLAIRSAPGLSMVFFGRLDNREDAAKLLGKAGEEVGQLRDSEVCLKAYKERGAAGIERLLGDWALAVYDERRGEVFLARDHFGNTSLYYHAGTQHFAFACTLRGLLALPFVPKRLDEEALACRMARWRRRGGTGTLYHDIHVLPPGHWLRVAKGEIETGRYWAPNGTRGSYINREDEAVEAFLEVFGEAVKCRLRGAGRIGLMLSSGLDSGSVAALAAETLAESGGSLQAYTAVPIIPPEAMSPFLQLGDERPGVEAMREFIPSLAVYFLDCANTNPVKGIREVLRLSGEPRYATANFFWVMAALRAASEDGVKVLLTGQHGNLTVSWEGTGFHSRMLLNGRWGTLAGELAEWRRAQGASWGRVLAARLAKPLLTQAVEQAGYVRDLFWPKIPEYSAIHPQFARRVLLGNKPAVESRRPSADVHQRRMERLSPDVNRIGSLWSEMSAPFGVDVRDPTADVRVVEFCLGLPDEFAVRHGWDRWLIRRAMKGKLPDAVRLNRRRGRQSADLIYRLRLAKDEVNQALDEVRRCQLAREMLNLEKMELVWKQAQIQQSEALTLACGHILLGGLMTGLFLKEF